MSAQPNASPSFIPVGHAIGLPDQNHYPPQRSRIYGHNPPPTVSPAAADLRYRFSQQLAAMNTLWVTEYISPPAGIGAADIVSAVYATLHEDSPTTPLGQQAYISSLLATIVGTCALYPIGIPYTLNYDPLVKIALQNEITQLNKTLPTYISTTICHGKNMLKINSHLKKIFGPVASLDRKEQTFRAAELLSILSHEEAWFN